MTYDEAIQLLKTRHINVDKIMVIRASWKPVCEGLYMYAPPITHDKRMSEIMEVLGEGYWSYSYLPNLQEIHIKLEA